VTISREDLAYAFAVGKELYGERREETVFSLADLLLDIDTGDAAATAV
jgi:hypothetical protein